MHIPASYVPLLFEALPSSAHADRRAQERHLRRLRPLRDHALAGILVPHVADGEYETLDPCTFAARLREETGHRVGVARVTTDAPLPDLIRWCQTAREAGVRDLFLVGASSHLEAGAGPDVHDALRRLRHGSGAASLGVVTIPSRRRSLQDEPHRLLRKRRAGADYAVSQILFDAEPALALRRAHSEALAPGEAPAPVYWNLAPVTRRRDITLLEQLGVHIPAELRVRLWDAPTRAERVRISTEHACTVARKLLDAAATEGHGATGLCVSHVTLGNLDASIGLLQALAPVARHYSAHTTAVPPTAVPA